MASNRSVRDRLSCRQVLNIMVILGFMLNYMLRINLTIAIVSMVIPSNSSGQHSHSNGSVVDECGVQATMMNDFTPIGDTRTPAIDVNVNRVNEMNNGSTLAMFPHWHREERVQTKYPWNEYEVNMILGSFFWGYICTEFPGGRLAEIIGTKRVFGYSMLASSFVTLLTPLAATLGYTAVVALRVVLGFMLGATWPAIQPMTARWIPPTERSKFVSHMMASSLGAAITMLMCGFLIASLGWESVFYVTGVIGIIWSVTWFLLVFDSPSEHPRISAEERHFIESAIGTTTTAKHLPIPWRALITSGPVWAIIITHACSVFGYHTIVNQLPTYMKYILHFNIKENGLLSSLPYLGKYIFALSMSILADYLLRNNKLSVTAIRKIFTTFAVLTPGILMVIQAYYGCNRAASVIVFTVALTINGGITAGYLGNGLDIAPNFSGTIFGIANTFSSIGGFLSTFMVGNITYQNQTYSQWTIIFWILAAVYFSGAVTFVTFGTGELQSWNNPPGSHTKTNGATVEDGVESVPLKSKTIS
ncbi:PREDICTED: putative inorganic phosphate cotransporter [Wasmannia auropunctata]|uniref:putative inorganic phosphate cotransporter n=1 Tax=Wasmannia auropunctata TaxID=64793 RepID=UPI0005ED895E|nr:PREDICTED: putative inorganic phosphate cotransporter [Wasmannia auropunctata]